MQNNNNNNNKNIDLMVDVYTSWRRGDYFTLRKEQWERKNNPIKAKYEVIDAEETIRKEVDNG